MMTSIEALRIIETLAGGTDPDTQQPLHAGSIYQQPDTIRALFIAVDALRLVQERPPTARARTLPEKTGKPWTEVEDKQLCDAFTAGTSLVDLAQKHQRTAGGIEARLVKHGKIAPQEGKTYQSRSSQAV
jgi:hypothetical protein